MFYCRKGLFDSKTSHVVNYIDVNKTAYCNHEFYLNREYAPGKSGTHVGQNVIKNNSTLQEQFNRYQDSRIINQLKTARNI